MKLFRQAINSWIKNFAVFINLFYYVVKIWLLCTRFWKTIGLIIKENEANSNYSRTSYGVGFTS